VFQIQNNDVNLMQDLNDLYYFAQVVRHGGFAPAERATGIPKSRLSRRVANLEESLGVRLLQRSTRSFSVTAVGQTYYRHIKAMIAEAEAAQESIDVVQGSPRGIVRITCPIDLLQSLVGDLLVSFMQQCSEITLHLESTNRRVDPVGEGIDIALRVRPPPLEDSDLVLRVLSQRPLYLLTSPSLLAERSTPKSPDDLSDWPSLDRGPPHKDHHWTLSGPDGEKRVIAHQPRLVTDSMVTLCQAAVAGMGLVELPALIVSDQIQCGELIEILPDWSLKPGITHMVYPSRRGQIPAVRALIDFLVEQFAALDDKTAVEPG